MLLLKLAKLLSLSLLFNISVGYVPQSAFSPKLRHAAAVLIQQAKEYSPTFSSHLAARKPLTSLEASLSEEIETPAATNVTVTAVVDDPELIQKEEQLLKQMEEQAALIVDEMMEESCEVVPETGLPADDLCIDEEKRKGFRATVSGYIKRIESMVVGRSSPDEEEDEEEQAKPKKALSGDSLEKGCTSLVSFLPVTHLTSLLYRGEASQLIRSAS